MTELTRPEVGHHVIEKEDPLDGTTITFEFWMNPEDKHRIMWSAEWGGGETSHYTQPQWMNDDAHTITLMGQPEINGAICGKVTLDEDTYRALKTDVEAVKEYRDEMDRLKAMGENEFLCDNKKVWTEGSGEVHKRVALVDVIETETGNVVEYEVWNQVDFGWHAAPQDDVPDEFDERATEFLRENSPIATGHRQFASDK